MPSWPALLTLPAWFFLPAVHISRLLSLPCLALLCLLSLLLPPAVLLLGGCGGNASWGALSCAAAGRGRCSAMPEAEGGIGLPLSYVLLLVVRRRRCNLWGRPTKGEVQPSRPCLPCLNNSAALHDSRVEQPLPPPGRVA
jgi:hypothetical protein